MKDHQLFYWYPETVTFSEPQFKPHSHSVSPSENNGWRKSEKENGNEDKKIRLQS